MKTLVPRFIKLGLILATFGSAATAQSLSTFYCSPTTIAVGGSFRCKVAISSPAPSAGFPIKISTAATGVTHPATVTIPSTQTAAIFGITTSTSILPQIVNLTATAGTISLTAAITVTSTFSYSVTTLACSPGTLIPSQTATCTAYLSGQAPASGLVATLSSSAPSDLPVPPSVSIPAGASGFQFKTTASSLVSAKEPVTISAVVQSNARTVSVTIDPTPKFHLKANNVELNLLTNGATITPNVAPAGCLGMLTVRGTGYIAFDPTVGTSGFNFHRNGGQNTNTSFVNFPGAACGQLFANSSEISFSLKSAYSFAERKLLPASNARGVFEVFDDAGSMYLFTTSTTSAGSLQFNYASGGNATGYTVPAGQEDTVFGKGVVARIKIQWTANTVNLYVNGTLVQTSGMTGRAGYWTTNPAITIGSRSARIAGGGLYASDDSIAEFLVR